jgi:hypothetical protein
MRETVFITDVFENGIVDDAPAGTPRPDPAEIEIAEEFLSRFATKARQWRAGTSYGLKHRAERWHAAETGVFKSVGNGALIIAAFRMGFEAKRDGRTPNVRYKMKLAEER